MKRFKKMIKNKKAWLRIVEAFIAVLIVAGVLLFTITKVPEQDKSSEIHSMQRSVLRQVSTNNSLRGEIINEDKTNTESFIREQIPGKWSLNIQICDIENICKMEDYMEKEVYVDEILISSNLSEFKPKKLKLFMWES